MGQNTIDQTPPQAPAAPEGTQKTGDWGSLEEDAKEWQKNHPVDRPWTKEDPLAPSVLQPPSGGATDAPQTSQFQLQMPAPEGTPDTEKREGNFDLKEENKKTPPPNFTTPMM